MLDASAFAISRLRLRPRWGDQGIWKLGTGRSKVDREARSAEMGMTADGGGRVELSSNRTTDVTLLVTICR